MQQIASRNKDVGLISSYNRTSMLTSSQKIILPLITMAVLLIFVALRKAK
jgi:hypothetical protein